MSKVSLQSIIEAVHDHLVDSLEGEYFVLHEEQSSLVHIDVHVLHPAPGRPYFVLLTSGMSLLPMKVPEGLEKFSRAEILLCLPPDWPLSRSNLGWREPSYFWPIQALKSCALYLHEHQTWLAYGHSVGLPTFGGANAHFEGVVFMPPNLGLPGFDRIAISRREYINVLAMIPMVNGELAFKLNHGIDALAGRFEAAGITELLIPDRPSICPDH